MSLYLHHMPQTDMLECRLEILLITPHQNNLHIWICSPSPWPTARTPLPPFFIFVYFLFSNLPLIKREYLEKYNTKFDSVCCYVFLTQNPIFSTDLYLYIKPTPPQGYVCFRNPKTSRPKILIWIFDPPNLIICVRLLHESCRSCWDLSIPTSLTSFHPPYMENFASQEIRSDGAKLRSCQDRFIKSKFLWWVCRSFNSTQLSCWKFFDLRYRFMSLKKIYFWAKFDSNQSQANLEPSLSRAEARAASSLSSDQDLVIHVDSLKRRGIDEAEHATYPVIFYFKIEIDIEYANL
jgi:hypothetical protein